MPFCTDCITHFAFCKIALCVFISFFCSDCILQSAFARLHFAFCVFLLLSFQALLWWEGVEAVVLVHVEGVAGVGKVAGGFEG